MAVINVSAYGVHVDNASDDAIHLRSAIAAAATGDTVYLDVAGTYHLSSHVTYHSPNTGYLPLKTGITFRGQGSRTVLKGTTALNSILCASPGVRNVTVDNMVLYSTIGATSNNGDGIKFDIASSVLVQRVTATSFYCGLNFIGCTNVLVKDSVAHHCRFTGFSFENLEETAESKSSDVRARGCEAHDCQRGFWAVGHKQSDTYRERCINFEWRDCYSHDNTEFGFTAKYASEGRMIDCLAGTNPSADVYLNNVRGFDYHNSPVPYLVTAANQAADYANWGSEECGDVKKLDEWWDTREVGTERAWTKRTPTSSSWSTRTPTSSSWTER